MQIAKTILLILEIVASLALVVIVLLQSGKEAGLSGALSGSSDTYLSKNKKATFDRKLASATKWVALVWVIITLALSVVATIVAKTPVA